MARRKPARRRRAKLNPAIALQRRMRALGALRRLELAQAHADRRVAQSRGRGAINTDYVRYVAKRTPEGVLPDEVWTFLIEGGTGLRKRDLMWAVTALSAMLDQMGARGLSAKAAAEVSEQWGYIADWLRSTRVKISMPWAEALNHAQAWHQRESAAKKRKEARAHMKGRKPSHKPFLRFPDGDFAVILENKELDLEGAACAHCLDSGRSFETHFSLRTPDNLPYFSGSFTTDLGGGDGESGFTFVESKGNYNLLPPKHVKKVRAAWQALLPDYGDITDIRSTSDFVALWLPKALKDQRRFNHDALNEASLAAFSAFIDDASGFVSWELLGSTIASRTSPKAPATVTVERFNALFARNPGGAVAFARGLSRESFAALLDAPEVPSALLMIKAGKTVGPQLYERRNTRLHRANAPRPALTVQAATWRQHAAQTSLSTAAVLDQGGFAAWLLLAPRKVIRPLLLEAARHPNKSVLLKLARDTDSGAVEEAFTYQAQQLPRRDLRKLAAAMPTSWQEIISWVRPDVAYGHGDVSSVLHGRIAADESPGFMASVARLSPKSYSAITRRILTASDLLGFDWYDDQTASYHGNKTDRQLAAERARVKAYGSTLWSLINLAPQNIDGRVLLAAVNYSIQIDRTMTEASTDLQTNVTVALGEAIADLAAEYAALPPRKQRERSLVLYEDLANTWESLDVMEGAITSLVKTRGGEGLPAAVVATEWWRSSTRDRDGWAWLSDWTTAARRAQYPGMVWVADYVGGALWDELGEEITDAERDAALLFGDTHGLPRGPAAGITDRA